MFLDMYTLHMSTYSNHYLYIVTLVVVSIQYCVGGKGF